MKVRIRHTTRYRYMDRVFLEPHVLRLTPRSAPYIHILSRVLSIDPTPAGRTEVIENDGTAATVVWFQGMTLTLNVEIETEIQADPFNPFEFLVHPASCLRLPMVYPQTWAGVLGPYLATGDDGPEVAAFAQDISDASRHDLLTMLTTLCRTVANDFEYEKRPSGSPHAPAQTLAQRKGSCRDFVALTMAVCRYLGLACRYVSGYYLSEESDEPDDLHAWMEVFLPGAGWRGFDPANAIACDHHHLALSASADPSLTLPITGSFRGQTSSRMEVQVSLRTMS